MEEIEMCGGIDDGYSDGVVIAEKKIKMISIEVYSERFKRIFWKRNQTAYAALAHHYPCCDIPTNKLCSACFLEVPCLLRRNKAKCIVVGRGGSTVANLYLSTLAGMTEHLPYHLKQEILGPIRKLTKTKPEKQCLLPGCKNMTTHNGGYCCAEHCRAHRGK